MAVHFVACCANWIGCHGSPVSFQLVLPVHKLSLDGMIDTVGFFILEN